MTVPKITHGYAKNKRFDLKQLLYGSLVSHDGGVPLLGAALDGNASDIAASTQFMNSMRKLVRDPAGVAFVADCKGWNPRVLEQSRLTGIRVLSRLERGRSLSKKLMKDSPTPTHSILLKYSTKHGHWDYRTVAGSDECYEYTLTAASEETDDSGKPTREKISIPVRTLVCFSSKLYRQKKKTLAKRAISERASLVKKIKKWERREYACVHDASASLQKYRDESRGIIHHIAGSVGKFVRTLKRTGAGRPKKDAPAAKKEQRYRLQLHIIENTAEEREQQLRDAATFI